MSVQPLQQAIAAARGVLENVQADQLQNATPCASWDVSALINHMVGGQKFFTAAMNDQPPSQDETNWAGQDYLAAFDEASQQTVEAFSAEGALDKTVNAPFGQVPGQAFLGLTMTDTFTHAWDLAKATGQNTDLNPHLAQGILAASQQSIQDAFRGDEGAPFGAEQQCADDACAADKLAAFLGRDVS